MLLRIFLVVVCLTFKVNWRGLLAVNSVHLTTKFLAEGSLIASEVPAEGNVSIEDSVAADGITESGRPVRPASSPTILATPASDIPEKNSAQLEPPKGDSESSSHLGHSERVGSDKDEFNGPSERRAPRVESLDRYREDRRVRM